MHSNGVRKATLGAEVHQGQGEAGEEGKLLSYFKLSGEKESKFSIFGTVKNGATKLKIAKDAPFVFTNAPRNNLMVEQYDTAFSPALLTVLGKGRCFEQKPMSVFTQKSWV
ncbi:MAG: hypothetical protein BRC40_01440 [Cyanobacteria bacterium QH_8_48_120]|nr:MAG: hypothetical protein BRC35_10055 [Cyanobacteria bacterium QH_10_48_56]PSO61172.1 MAG: hypothetical protein BRC39_08460 [Cyanobacteria bacterium QH_7_48_89]PSO68552.1 MAG: hypothetical protein BRC42_13425 [Cyanobacteria bacterium QS_1_48_34]PSO71501.1 MAG: hypothetical protein BRC37_13550 [Cyanobacteria bacterium QH_3_48_40]PSO77721.1 MAG: hypothetical protein BRC40_01440 [Cyanobacteria bacterium QH_8_48_120]PSO82434.1 MAG: hypothetical protein BRC45_09640 [Cyanobacteria bacterium QS_5_